MTADRDAIMRAAVDSGRAVIIPVGDAAPAAPPGASTPGPLPPGTMWRRAPGRGQWAAILPGSWSRVGVQPVTDRGPRGGVRRAWVARVIMGAGRIYTTPPHPTRDAAARDAFHAACLIAPVYACPDCGQEWPDGCAFDCPSRDE